MFKNTWKKSIGKLWQPHFKTRGNFQSALCVLYLQKIFLQIWQTKVIYISLAEKLNTLGCIRVGIRNNTNYSHINLRIDVH